MKKLSRKQRAYSIRVSRKREKRRLLSKAKQAIARGGRPRATIHIVKKAARAQHAIRVVAPKDFLLESERARSALMQMLDTVRRQVVTLGRPVKIDFRQTRQMYPSGALLFRAELDRIRSLIGGRRLISATYPVDIVVEQVLHQIGMLGTLGLEPRRDPAEFPENVRHWRAATGGVVVGEEVDPIVSNYQGVLAESLTKGLYDGIVESMSNSIQHAYEGPRADGLGAVKSWWMFSQEAGGALTVALCDLGIGIPESLSTSKKWRGIIDRLLTRVNLSSPDASLIKEAIELHKTRTGEEHRGKGLGDILDVVRGANAGSLRIMSDRGLYGFNGVTRREELRDLSRSIMGTIVLWTIPLATKP